MTNYYFLASILPEISIGAPPELSFFEIDRLFESNLTKSDQAQVATILTLHDIENMRNLWNEVPLSDYGCFDEGTLDEAMLTQTGLPGYAYEFLDRYDTDESRLKHYPGLVSAYFREEIPNASGFLQSYLEFERGWRLVATAYRSKVMGRNVMEELQFEDPNDDLVAQIIAQRDAPTFEPPAQFEVLASILEGRRESPMELHQALCEWRFEQLQQMTGGEFFSVDRILSYLVRLIIVEKWLELDSAKGREIVEKIVKEAS